MSGRTKAAVRGVMLRWARETSGLSLADAAGHLGISSESLGGWEADQSVERPSLAQVKKLAGLYGRSPILLYLPEPPSEAELPADYRMGRSGDTVTVSPSLRKVIRRMRDLRDAALDLADDLEETAEVFPEIPLRATLKQDIVPLADRIRQWLGISLAKQAGWRDAKQAFSAWREALETRGVIVFVELGAHSLPASEVRGLCIAEDQAPVILINNHDAKNAQVFTLLHEVGHIMLREPALCLDMEDEGIGNDRGSTVEAWCNRLAGEILVPVAALKEHPLTSALAGSLRKHPEETNPAIDAQIREMASNFSISAEVVVRRLAVVGLISTKAYLAWRSSWYERHPVASPRREPFAAGKKKGGPSPAQLAPTRFGMRILSLVYSAYWSDARSALEVGEMLGGRMKTVLQTESIVRRKLRLAAST